MVIHDSEKTEQWAQMRAEQERQKPRPADRRASVWSVITVQSIACLILAVLVLLFRLAGGSAYEGLQDGFYNALEKNELMTLLSRAWDNDPFADLQPSEEIDVKQDGFTDGS